MLLCKLVLSKVLVYVHIVKIKTKYKNGNICTKLPVYVHIVKAARFYAHIVRYEKVIEMLPSSYPICNTKLSSLSVK